MENALSPVTDPIRSLIPCIKIRYLLLADVTRSCRPRPDLLTGIVLKVPLMGRGYFGFPNKRQGKKVSGIRFSNSANKYPVYFVTHLKNTHSDLIAKTIAA